MSVIQVRSVERKIAVYYGTNEIGKQFFTSSSGIIDDALKIGKLENELWNKAIGACRMRNQNVGKKYQKEKCNENTVDGLAKKAETGAEQQNQEHG